VDAGRRIGKYVLDERIAVGGMAEVWAARAEGMQGFVKPVALKFILESFSGDPELERLFVNEARIAARLQHANLVTVFDFDKVAGDQEKGLAGRYYIAMERVEGHDLRRIWDAARRTGYVFPVGMALYLAGEVLKALRYVHERREGRENLGLVHRDVSPHNVLVGYTGEVKLSDFGIAKAREHSARATKPGSLRGKISYASPEQLSGLPVDHRTDQFAAAVTIWELLAGRRLFDGAAELEIIGKVARCEIPPLTGPQGRRDVPSPVEAVLRRMLSPRVEDRYPTTAEALSAVLSLSSYTPDGAPLGELVRALFLTAGTELAETMRLDASPVPRLDADGATRTMREPDRDAASDDLPSSPVGAPQTPTRRAARTSVALARSPVAAGTPLGDSQVVTEDVRTGRRAAKVLAGALLVVLVAAAAVAARSATDRTALTAGATRLPAPPAAPTKPVPAPGPAPAAETLPTGAPAAPAAGAVVGARTTEALERGPASGPRARGHAPNHPRASRSGDDLVPAAGGPEKGPAPSTRQSANGAPILE
jgi:serine/threonine-protein kinase